MSNPKILPFPQTQTDFVWFGFSPHVFLFMWHHFLIGRCLVTRLWGETLVPEILVLSWFLVKCPAVFCSGLSDQWWDFIRRCSLVAFDCCVRTGEYFSHKRPTQTFSVRQRPVWGAQWEVKLSFCLHAIKRSLVCPAVSLRLEDECHETFQAYVAHTSS